MISARRAMKAQIKIKNKENKEIEYSPSYFFCFKFDPIAQLFLTPHAVLHLLAIFRHYLAMK